MANDLPKFKMARVQYLSQWADIHNVVSHSCLGIQTDFFLEPLC